MVWYVAVPGADSRRRGRICRCRIDLFAQAPRALAAGTSVALAKGRTILFFFNLGGLKKPKEQNEHAKLVTGVFKTRVARGVRRGRHHQAGVHARRHQRVDVDATKIRSSPSRRGARGRTRAGRSAAAAAARGRRGARGPRRGRHDDGRSRHRHQRRRPLAAALAGWARGGATGGLIGALVGAGIPSTRAKVYDGPCAPAASSRRRVEVGRGRGAWRSCSKTGR